MHIGNYLGDTDGCILLGDKPNNNVVEHGFLAESTKAFQRVYLMLSQAIEEGEKIFIRIENGQRR